jgi:hypothetical protein
MKAYDEIGDLVADVIMAVLTTTASERKQLIVVLPIICRLPIIFIMMWTRSRYLSLISLVFGMLFWRALSRYTHVHFKPSKPRTVEWCGSSSCISSFRVSAR